MNKITKVLLKSFLTNISLSIIKIVAGTIAASGALIADGVHSLSDTLTDIFAIVGHKLSAKPADYNHPFGHGKIEYLTCLFIGFVIIFMGISVIYNGLFEGSIIPNAYVAIASVLVIIAKIILANYILKKGIEYDNNILIASGKESFSDVISSMVVLVAIIISQLGYINDLFVYADTLAMIIVGILILRIGYNILKDNFSSLLGEKVTDEDYLQKVENIIYKVDDIKHIDSLIIVKYGFFYQVNINVSMDENMKVKDAHQRLDTIEKRLRKFDDRLKYITIHVNPYSITG